ncbi:hypothetical protein [Sphingobacterium sp. GVS05A]|uniref:hypothetical protein n=1 Tax=Sphingobacterium TaxID=28453 RepID=UPI001CBB44C9|nr:hypothetical protein [Sphingobacterium sp. GVS05A]
MDGYTGKCRGKTTERSQERGRERGRRNRGMPHGSGYPGRRGYGKGGNCCRDSITGATRSRTDHLGNFTRSRSIFIRVLPKVKEGY